MMKLVPINYYWIYGPMRFDSGFSSKISFEESAIKKTDKAYFKSTVGKAFANPRNVHDRLRQSYIKTIDEVISKDSQLIDQGNSVREIRLKRLQHTAISLGRKGYMTDGVWKNLIAVYSGFEKSVYENLKKSMVVTNEGERPDHHHMGSIFEIPNQPDSLMFFNESNGPHKVVREKKNDWLLYGLDDPFKLFEIEHPENIEEVQAKVKEFESNGNQTISKTEKELLADLGAKVWTCVENKGKLEQLHRVLTFHSVIDRCGLDIRMLKRENKKSGKKEAYIDDIDYSWSVIEVMDEGKFQLEEARWLVFYYFCNGGHKTNKCQPPEKVYTRKELEKLAQNERGNNLDDNKRREEENRKHRETEEQKLKERENEDRRQKEERARRETEEQKLRERENEDRRQKEERTRRETEEQKLREKENEDRRQKEERTRRETEEQKLRERENEDRRQKEERTRRETKNPPNPPSRERNKKTGFRVLPLADKLALFNTVFVASLFTGSVLLICAQFSYPYLNSAGQYVAGLGHDAQKMYQNVFNKDSIISRLHDRRVTAPPLEEPKVSHELEESPSQQNGSQKDWASGLD